MDIIVFTASIYYGWFFKTFHILFKKKLIKFKEMCDIDRIANIIQYVNMVSCNCVHGMRLSNISAGILRKNSSVLAFDASHYRLSIVQSIDIQHSPKSLDQAHTWNKVFAKTRPGCFVAYGSVLLKPRVIMPR